MTISPTNPTVGQVVTLSAFVSAGSMPVGAGTVAFLDGQAVLGTVQMNKSTGIATLKTRFAPGIHSIIANYNGTNNFAKSSSGPQPLTVTGTAKTASSLSAVANGGNYDFTLNVFGFGYPAPTGTASLDETSQNMHLGDFTLAGQGTVAVQAPGLYPAGNDNLAVAVGDFNNDGIPDLVVPNMNDNTVSVLLGNGDGTFGAQTASAVDSQPRAVAVADFDGDGNLDIAVGLNNAGQGLDILLGNGDGTFKPSKFYDFDNTQGLAIGDFNNDGFPDIALFNSVSLVVYLNNQDGTFNTNGQFVSNFSALVGMDVGDFNGDGNLDVVVSDNSTNSVSVLLGDGTGGWSGSPLQQPVGDLPWGVVAADLNGDTILDIAVVDWLDGTVSVLLGNGDGTFRDSSTPDVGIAPYNIATADWNGDGFADLVTTNFQDNTVSVLLGNGDGTFQPQLVFAGAPNNYGLSAADLDGDGVPDLALANQLTNKVGVLIAGTSLTAKLQNIAIFGQGQQTVQGTYSPNTQFYAGSLSNSLILNGTQLPTTTTLTSQPNPSGVLQTVTFTAVVSGSGNGSPTGTVSFLSSFSVLCDAVPLMQMGGVSVATCQTAFSNPGTYLILANYSGDNNYQASSGSSQQTVTGQFQYIVTLSVAGQNQGSSIVLTAMVVPPHCDVNCQPPTNLIPTGTVRFYTDVGDLGSAQLNGQATATITVSNPGAFTAIYAHYSGDANFLPATSDPQDSVAPPLVVEDTQGAAGSTISVALALTVPFPDSPPPYYKKITCDAPLNLGISCTPNPEIITSNSQASVDLKTSSNLAYNLPGSFGRSSYRVVAAFSGLGLMGIVWVGVGSIRRPSKEITKRILFLIAICLLLGMSGCGAFQPAMLPGGGTTVTTPPGTYFITGTATLYRKAAPGAGQDLQIGTPQSFLIQLLVK